MEKKSRRDSTMDALRGAAILLVVIGHAIQVSYSNFDANSVFRVIYAFHMPLFMFVSGYVAFYARDNQSWAHLCKKASALVLPFVVWYAVGYVITAAYLRTGLIEYFTRWILAPDQGLWFLWVLFLGFTVLAAACRLERFLKDWSIPAAWLALQLVPVHAFGFDLLRWHFTFFALGFLAHRHLQAWVRYRPHLAAMSLVTFPLLVTHWRRGANPDFAVTLANFLNPHHLHAVDLFVLGLYSYAVPLLGIVAAWCTVSVLATYGRSSYRLFGWLGLHTLEVYVTHQYLVSFGVGDGMVHVATGAIIALAGSLTISFAILRRPATVAHLFLGKPYPTSHETGPPPLEANQRRSNQAQPPDRQAGLTAG